MKKKLLFVINTLGGAGAERALLTLMSSIDPNEYDIYCYVMLSQGELISEVPDHITVLNRKVDPHSVLAAEGKRHMIKAVLNATIRRFSGLSLMGYMMRNYKDMKRKGRVQIEKLLWRVLSDGAERFDTEYDLAVAFLEGASTYYVADHVKAKKKAAVVHVDYEMAGYTRMLDKDAYEAFDRIFCVSDEVRSSYLKVYPEYEDKTDILHNMIDEERILRLSAEKGGFDDDYDGFRVLTVGRLNPQKAYEVAIDALAIIKEKGYRIRWYVLGEGDLRDSLKELITSKGLDEDFILCGAKKNPYPYYRQCDIYVHATRYEGKSIAVQEAQVLKKPIIVSDVPGNREQIDNGVDGLIVSLDANEIANAVIKLHDDRELMDRFSKTTVSADLAGLSQRDKLLKLIGD